ncbi:MAG: hypothetical protein ACLR0F_14640 [Eisenbergiella sp.]
MSRIIKSGQAVYQDLEVAVYGETFESAEEEEWPEAQEGYTLISEEKGIFWSIKKPGGIHGGDPFGCLRTERKANTAEKRL